MPVLDIDTLLVVISLLALVSAMIMFLLWRVNTEQRGVFLWFISSLLNAAAYSSPVFFNAGAYGIFINNMLIITSLLLMLEGAFRFRGHPSTRRWLAALVILPVVGVFTWLNVESPLLRYRVVDVLTIAVFVSIAVIMTRRTRSSAELVIYGTAALFCSMMAVLVGVRWVTAMTITGPFALTDTLTFNRILFTGFAVFTVGWTYSITLACYFRAQQAALQMAREDPLTGLPNRRSIDEVLKREILRSQRSGRKFTLLVLDLDGFKTVNDSMGHAAGDTMLTEIALRLRAQARDADFVARLGGDEFLVVLHDIESDADRQAAIARFHQCLQEPFELNGQSIRISTSVGAAEWGTDGDTVDQLLQTADRRMYRDKSESIPEPEPT